MEMEVIMEMEVRSIVVNVRGLAAAAQSPTVITQADAVVQSVEAEAKAVEPRAPTTVERADVYVLPSGQAAGEGQRREDVPQASGQSPEGETRTRTRAPERSSSREAVTAKVANDDEARGSSSNPSNQASKGNLSTPRYVAIKRDGEMTRVYEVGPEEDIEAVYGLDRQLSDGSDLGEEHSSTYRGATLKGV